MNPPAVHSRRRVLGLLAWGLALGSLPWSSGQGGAAWARDGEDNSGSGGGGDRDNDDRDEDRDDDSGRGRGRGRGHGGDDPDEDDDRDGDDDGEEDRSGWQDPARDPAGDRGDGSSGWRASSARDQPRDVTVRYPDGWVERIVGGRYELIDHQSRLVVRRAATADDFARMIALR